MTGKAYEQQKRLRLARKRLDITTEELAAQLGRSLPTVRAWLTPETSKAHRAMPKPAQDLLERIIAEDRKAKR